MSENQLSSYHLHLQDTYSLQPIQAIAEGLANNKTLRDLSIANNGLFGTYYDTQSESLGKYDPVSIKILAEGIAKNGDNGGSLRSVNILGNRFGGNVDVCESCDLPCVHLWHGLLPDCLPECPGSNPVTHLLAVVEAHPHLHTLVGAHPGMDKLGLAGLKLCDQWLRIVMWEVQRHQYITSVDLNTNYFSPRGVRTIARGLQHNVGLHSLYLPSFLYLNRLHQRDFQVPSSLAVTYLEGEVGRAKYQASQFRLMLARVVRYLCGLGASPLLNMLEYLLGQEAQPLIHKFVRYRAAFTETLIHSEVSRSSSPTY